jgi:ESS family glutamate:Na+ symporter
MIAFFTSIGFGASVPLLRSGGPAVALFLGLATAVAVLQNLVGAAVAAGLGVPPLLGVLAGSVTLTGGPATGLAFAPLFEEAGVKGAATLAVASAMAGIVSGGIIGGPIGTFLIEGAAVPPRPASGVPEPAGRSRPRRRPDARAGRRPPAGEDVGRTPAEGNRRDPGGHVVGSAEPLVHLELTLPAYTAPCWRRRAAQPGRFTGVIGIFSG